MESGFINTSVNKKQSLKNNALNNQRNAEPFLTIRAEPVEVPDNTPAALRQAQGERDKSALP
ncbi:MAG: hypothetical protein FWF41_08010 [Betaproteobacteria bacterium]|nr:hypothetical protein [Betaproteobacteria bacterium]